MSKQRLVAVGMVLLVVGVLVALVDQYRSRNDPIVRMTEASCAVAQRAYDDGKRDNVLFDIIRDCDRSGYPVRR